MEAIKQHINLLKTTRNNFKKLLDSMSLEQINQVPDGLNNNVIWNYAHAILSTGVLVYEKCGLENGLPKEWSQLYRKDSKVERPITQEELEEVVKLGETTLIDLEKNYQQKVFPEYQPYLTSYGFQLHSVEDAIEFCIAHEALHLGYAMAIRKKVLAPVS